MSRRQQHSYAAASCRLIFDLSDPGTWSYWGWSELVAKRIPFLDQAVFYWPM